MRAQIFLLVTIPLLKKLLTLSPDGTGMMTEDGEIVPGVSVELRPLKFEAKPAEKKK